MLANAYEKKKKKSRTKILLFTNNCNHVFPVILFRWYGLMEINMYVALFLTRFNCSLLRPGVPAPVSMII